MVNTGFIERRFLWLIGFLCAACGGQQSNLVAVRQELLSQSLMAWHLPPADSVLAQIGTADASQADSMGFGTQAWLTNATRMRSVFVTLGTPRVKSAIHTISCPNALEAQQYYASLEAWLGARLSNDAKNNIRFGRREWRLPDRHILLELNTESQSVVVSVLYLGQTGT